MKEKGITAIQRVTIAVILTALIVGAGVYFIVTPKLGGQEEEGVKTVKIGGIFPLSGPASKWGGPLLRGLKWAISDINEKKPVIGGQRVEFKAVPYDGELQPTSFVNGLKQFEFRGVHFICGTINAGGVKSVAPTLSEDMIILPGTSSDAVWKLSNEYPGIWQVSTPDRFIGPIMGHLIYEAGFKKMAFLSSEREGTLTLAKSVKKGVVDAGGEITSFQTFPPSKMEFGSLVTKVAETNPDGIWVKGTPDQVLTIISTIHRKGLDVSHVWVPETYTKEQIQSVASIEEIKGTRTVPEEMLWRFYSEERIAEYENMFGRVPPDYIGLGYGSTMVLYAAMKKANTVDDIQKIRNAIAELKVDDVIKLTLRNFRPTSPEGKLFTDEKYVLINGFVVAQYTSEGEWKPTQAIRPTFVINGEEIPSLAQSELPPEKRWTP